MQRTQDPQQPQRLPQLNPDVIAKMRDFHNDMAALQAVKCLICFERFPSISVNEIGSCKRCHNDKHIPKLFSAANNMDPGIVPPELMVSNECCISTCLPTSFKGIISSGRNADFTSDTTNVYLPLTLWSVWI